MGRKNYIDYMRAMAIVLVVLGHINSSNMVLKSWVYEFHMPLFFFITGLTFSAKKIDLKILDEKVRSIIVPYIIWGLIYMEFSFGSLLNLLYGSYKSIKESNALSSLWFLPTLFVSYFVCQIVIRIKNRWLLGATAVALFVVAVMVKKPDVGYPWCIDISLMAATFIIIGYLVKTSNLKELTLGKSTILLIIGTLLTLCYKYDPINNDNYVLMAVCRIGNPCIFLTCALGGCMMIGALAKILEKLMPCNKVLIYIGQNTLAIFALNKAIIKELEADLASIIIPDGLKLTLICIICMLASIACTFVLNRYLPEIVGKKRTVNRD